MTVLLSTEVSPDGRERRWSWVSDLTLERKNVMAIMRARRARWRIDKELFKTLKTAGDTFEHTFGHGHKYLANVFSSLGMLAFLIDPMTEPCCGMFRQTFQKQIRKKDFWAAMVALFRTLTMNSWDVFHRLLSEPLKAIEGETLLAEP